MEVETVTKKDCSKNFGMKKRGIYFAYNMNAYLKIEI